MWSNEGAYQQHRAHYSKADMRWFDTATNSMSTNADDIGNTIPFNIVTGRTPTTTTTQLIDEGALRVPQTTYDEDTIF